ncbi:hypothetical protein MRB53_038241 [Persea americana]|nr:hypothetical protein MRB53_038241 [Persea americana]
MPFVKQIDTVAAEFPAYTNYLYLTYNGAEHDIAFEDRGIMVLGSGVYRIGSSVEFDWCSVRAIRTLREHGHKTVMINYNPETVSTDYDEADRLYFENITLETVLDIYALESSTGVIVSVGGQTPNNIAFDLHRSDVKVLGTSPQMIHNAENRYNFSRILDGILVDQPVWKNLTSIEEATQFCSDKYPVLVRPSYVLSGAAMNTVYSEKDLSTYLQQAADVSKEYPVVITKYIEGAKEIEMDAVAKDGKMLCHFISEHVENAGVHSGDATLILPPQDLDAETNKEIKVIECNIRASRSFPFVSKVMGVDLIEMATKAMVGIPVAAYPPTNITADYVGVKVPQFSFSRLSGADPVLGVEMASTGEVASFGRDKYEAYIKALISTGFRLPKKNVLFSIGSFEHKTEMLPSIEKLHQMGYKIFATPGTADFLQEHGIQVKYLEVLNEGDEDQSSEYSLTQHLANNLIDLYVNLPSSNRFRRPANYMSKGYRTRRMAVDYQTPLVTNVKIAKLLIEAISRNYDMEISKIDAQTSHRAVTLPGLINIAAFVPHIAKQGSQDLELVTKTSIMSGFSMIRVMPVGLESSIVDAASFRRAQHNSRRAGGVKCDFNLSVAATPDNATELSALVDDVGSLFMPFNHLSGNINKVATMVSHFGSWPSFKPIVTDAKTTDLASILLLASLHDRKVHVTSVTTKDDINVIALSKAKNLKVTCDVSVYALFLTQDDYPNCAFLPTAADQEALWSNLAIIDIFSVGALPYQVAQSAGSDAAPDVGIADTLPLLFSAIEAGRLTIEDIIARLHDNPKAIFDLHEQDGCAVEIEYELLHAEKNGRQPRHSLHGCGVLECSASPSSTRLLSMTASSHSLRQMAATCPHIFSLSPSRPRCPRNEGHVAAHSCTDRFVSAAARISIGRFEQTYTPAISARSRRLDRKRLSHFRHHSHSFSNSVTDLLAHSPFKAQHIISVDQFSKADLHLLFTVAQDMRVAVQRHGVLDILKGRVLCTLFFEPSTRTSASFDAAMQRLGGRTVPISTAHSSAVKGESLQDTVRTLACYTDAIVLRHPSNDSADIAAKFSPVPIINGGNGTREHPTQAFLDLFTIREELGTLNGLTITFIGDLKYGRTVHSVCKLLEHYNTTVQLVSPASLALPKAVRQPLIARGQLARRV